MNSLVVLKNNNGNNSVKYVNNNEIECWQDSDMKSLKNSKKKKNVFTCEEDCHFVPNNSERLEKTGKF